MVASIGGFTDLRTGVPSAPSARSDGPCAVPCDVGFLPEGSATGRALYLRASGHFSIEDLGHQNQNSSIFVSQKIEF